MLFLEIAVTLVLVGLGAVAARSIFRMRASTRTSDNGLVGGGGAGAGPIGHIGGPSDSNSVGGDFGSSFDGGGGGFDGGGGGGGDGG